MDVTKLIVAVAVVLSHVPAHAAPEPERSADHVLHVELSTLILVKGISINYEFFFDPRFALRVGYGASAVWAPTDSKSAHGPLAAFTFLHGYNHNLEVTLGVSVVDAGGREPPVGGSLGSGWWATPVAFVGYRYQPRSGGLVCRAGAGLGGGYGVGATIGIGGTW